MSMVKRRRDFAHQTRYASSFRYPLAKWWAQLLAALFDFGYIYIIRSSAKGRAGKIKYKIGIGYDLKSRAQSVDRSIKGSKEVPVFWVRVFFSEYYEGKLHDRFKKRRFRFTGSGKTEWFHLSRGEFREAMGWMKVYQAKQQLLIYGLPFAIFMALAILKDWANG